MDNFIHGLEEENISKHDKQGIYESSYHMFFFICDLGMPFFLLFPDFRIFFISLV